jgi:hypothetical protein
LKRPGGSAGCDFLCSRLLSFDLSGHTVPQQACFHTPVRKIGRKAHVGRFLTVVSLLSYGINTMAKDNYHVTTFTVDPRTADAIDHLKESFGVKTTASVLRKAIALARIAARNSDETGIITIEGPKGKEQVTLVG